MDSGRRMVARLWAETVAPEQHSADAIFVTRTGRKVVEEGPDVFYATERLQRNLPRSTVNLRFSPGYSQTPHVLSALALASQWPSAESARL